MRYQVSLFWLKTPTSDDGLILCLLQAPNGLLAERPHPEGFIRKFTSDEFAGALAALDLEERDRLDLASLGQTAYSLPNKVFVFDRYLELKPSQLSKMSFKGMAILAQVAGDIG